MQRRGFLGLLGAAIAVPFVPTPAVPAPTWIGVDLASKPDYAGWIRRGEYVAVTCFGNANKVYLPKVGPRIP
jgi:hypothetical protein